jgi:hypothetical protein
MSTVQTQINLVHLEAGLAVPSLTQRVTYGAQFSSNAIEVATSDETIPLGDIVTPKQVMVKLISGDPLRIGLDGSTYPFRLTATDEATILTLDAAGLVEISSATVIADSAGSLNDKYFMMYDRNGEVKVVITNDGITSITSSGRVVKAVIANGDAANVVASAIISAFTNDSEIVAQIVTAGIVKFSDKHTGTRANIAAGDSGFTVSTDQQGAASPIIHLKSSGVSQAVVAVASY